ncbi:MAG TPA: flagellar hook-length control protein FliK [Rhodopila sp.]|nr:flagellar hook-length control protein FliK [Rhodopila sp.]
MTAPPTVAAASLSSAAAQPSSHAGAEVSSIAAPHKPIPGNEKAQPSAFGTAALSSVPMAAAARASGSPVAPSTTGEVAATPALPGTTSLKPLPDILTGPHTPAAHTQQLAAPLSGPTAPPPAAEPPAPPVTLTPIASLVAAGSGSGAGGDPAPTPQPAAILNQVAAAAVPLTSVSSNQPSEAAKPPGGSAAAAASPPDQVAMAIVSVTKSNSNNQQVMLHLHPADLGSVQIRIERSGPGLARIEVVAAKPDTLTMLQNSQAQLHQSLDLAGMPADGRTLTFHMAAPQADTQAGNGNTPTSGLLDGGFANSGQPNGQGSGGGNRSPYQGQPADGFQGAMPFAPGDTLPAGALAARSYRVGLDITA